MMKTSKPVGWGQGGMANPIESWVYRCSSTSAKEVPTNTSMDSGVAGLRDTPVHTPASKSNTSSTATKSHHTANIPGASSNSNDEFDIPKFIVDRTTKITYIKGRFLGKGGFARVHELTDLSNNMTYAGKIIPKSRITKPHHKEKIAREIDVHSKLSHPHVVKLHTYFEDDSNVYIILENCPLKSLVHVVRQRVTVTEPEARYYVHQLVDGVAYVHREGIIHRDLKLGNMFLSHDMKVKIGDFGLAARSEGSRSVTICGTPNYIAPEVLNKQGHTFQSDTWAIGCIMYALLLGAPPFETDSLKQTYARITSNSFTVPPCVSAQAKDLIVRLLHPDPKTRPNLDAILKHDFFAKNPIPTSLPPTCCHCPPKASQLPSAPLTSLAARASPKPNSQTNQISQDIKKITSSVSSLRIPNLRVQSMKNENSAKSDGNTQNSSSPVDLQTNLALSRISQSESSNRFVNSQSEASITPKQSDFSNNNARNSRYIPNDSSNYIPTNSSNHCLDKSNNNSVDNISKDMSIYSSLGQYDKVRNAVHTQDSRFRRSKEIKSVSSGALYNLLATCLDAMPVGISSNPSSQLHFPVFVTKWIDYSNKYGFAYHLTDNTIGAFFNDLTRIVTNKDRSRLEFRDCNGRCVSLSSTSLPAWLAERYGLLEYFAEYMDDHLIHAADLTAESSSEEASPVAGDRHQQASLPQIRRWDRTDRIITIMLSNGCFQVNFFNDHSKLVIAEGCVVYVDSERNGSSYSMEDLASHGCDASLRERLVYALSCLRHYAELDGEEI